ncbi:PHD finger protein 7-like, partial [Melanerpes formicivorus]|uniref:PHD finger protein 7-like n=1 Tax=Melanerpes formicivorus TaxID=211600 RepID=UPI00358EC3C7
MLYSFQLCFVCGGSGASITCQESGCERSFHLPCATRGRCVTQYFEQYRAFCSRHRPQQAVLRDPEPDTDCLLCLEDVGDRQSYRTMVCPVCQHAWFHRDCIQGHALQAGTSAFRCLLCRDKDQFQQEMLRMGIRIPRRPPEWETAQEFAALMERHSQCDAQHCLCPGGRGQAEEEGPWQLLLCSSCAAEGTHRCCSQLEDSTAQWEC